MHFVIMIIWSVVWTVLVFIMACLFEAEGTSGQRLEAGLEKRIGNDINAGIAMGFGAGVFVTIWSVYAGLRLRGKR